MSNLWAWHTTASWASDWHRRMSTGMPNYYMRSWQANAASRMHIYHGQGDLTLAAIFGRGSPRLGQCTVQGRRRWLWSDSRTLLRRLSPVLPAAEQVR